MSLLEITGWMMLPISICLCLKQSQVHFVYKPRVIVIVIYLTCLDPQISRDIPCHLFPACACMETSSHVLFVNSQKSTEAGKLEKELNRFWDLETLGISENEKTIHEDFSGTIYMNGENRYEAKIPFRENHPFLHDHFSLCEKRLKTLHSNLKNDTVLLKRYNDIFVEQREMGIIEEAPDTGSPGSCHYIPHHLVIREDKNTSKITIVFDASAKSAGPSLNDCLYKAPQLTPLIFDILTRFRTYAIALTSDIEKAFLQISIEKNDRDFLRFLLFDDVFSNTPKIVRNRFARVIFGVTSSPFLLNQTI